MFFSQMFCVFHFIGAKFETFVALNGLITHLEIVSSISSRFARRKVARFRFVVGLPEIVSRIISKHLPNEFEQNLPRRQRSRFVFFVKMLCSQFVAGKFFIAMSANKWNDFPMSLSQMTFKLGFAVIFLLAIFFRIALELFARLLVLFQFGRGNRFTTILTLNWRCHFVSENKLKQAKIR